MANLLFIDTAYPLVNYPGGINGIAFYIGGDTPHVWSKTEIVAAPYQYRLPIYVRSNPPGPGAAADVAAAVAKLKAIGAPAGTLVAWDLEIAVDVNYILQVYGLLKLAGYTLIIYGSQSYVLGNRNPDGLYWGAQWTGRIHLAAPDVMTQYVNFGPYDESVAQLTLPFWNLKGSQPPPPPPQVNPWPLSEGAAGPHVLTLQAGLNRWGYAKPALVVDGSFGPATLTAVKTAQTAQKQTVNGIVGQPLWDLLLGNPPKPPPPKTKTITNVVVTFTDGSRQTVT